MGVESVRSLLTRYNRVRRIKPPKNLSNRQLIRMLERRKGRDMPWPVPARKRNNYHPSDAKLYSSEFLAVVFLFTFIRISLNWSERFIGPGGQDDV